jgi:hypothetical protein
VILEVSAVAFQEIKQKLDQAGYQQECRTVDGKVLIDMHNIALQEEGS